MTLFCGRWSNIPRYLPRTTRAASLLCILMRTAPLELCDTAAIAAAVFSSSSSLGTSKTALTITLTRWPSSASSRTWTLGRAIDHQIESGLASPAQSIFFDPSVRQFTLRAAKTRQPADEALPFSLKARTVEIILEINGTAPPLRRSWKAYSSSIGTRDCAWVRTGRDHERGILEKASQPDP